MSNLVVSDFLSANPVISIDENACLVDAIRLLSQNHISSCAITDKTGSVTGWIDWAGIIRFFVDYVWETKATKTLAPRSTVITKADLERLLDLSSSHRIQAVLQASRPIHERVQEHRDRATLPVLRKDSSIRKGLKMLGKQHLHQVPVEDDDGKVVGVFSQRDVLKFFAADPSRLGQLRYSTVSGLALATNSLSSVRESDIALDAFYMLSFHGFGGAAVIDKDGKLTHVLSVTDLALCEHDFSRLQSPVLDFVRHQTQVHTCSEKDTLEQVILTLAKHKVRRVFLVNAQNQPTGVVTLTDVCRVLHTAFGDKKRKPKNAKPEEKKTKGNKFKKHMEKEANKKGGKHHAWTKTEKK